MIQVYAQKNGQLYELDMYKEEPIKLTLSAEDITDIPKVESAFSRQFRIPATANNSRFFNYWFELDVLDFDVTQRVKAEIHVDGLIFKTGELRLQAAYKNNETDNVDLEVVFFGETRDFATEVGDLFMNQLDVSEISHELDHTYMHASQATEYDPTIQYNIGDHVYFSIFPGNPQYPYLVYRCKVNGTTNIPPTNITNWEYETEWNLGYLRYGLTIRGYEYDENGDIIQETDAQSNFLTHGQITLDNSNQLAFTNQNNYITANQYTPFVQVKYLIDKIFARTSYNYSDDSFFNEDWFVNLYTDGLASPSSHVIVNNPICEITASTYLADENTGIYEKVNFDNVVFDNENAFNLQTDEYTIQTTGNHEFNIRVKVGGWFEVFQSGSASMQIRNQLGQILYTDTETLDYNQPSKTLQVIIPSTSFNAGDRLSVWVTFYSVDLPQIEEGTFECTNAPAAVIGSSLLKDDITIVDFFKSILNRFRLVMVPTKDKANEFTIKPWKDYIASGEIFDWTYKLDNSKDITIKPTFFEQSAIINFTDVEGSDKYNVKHQDDFNYVYGRKLYDSRNLLLKDTRDIENVFAATPVAVVKGGEGQTDPMILPWFVQELSDRDKDNTPELDPILPKPRLLFWNGMQPTTIGFYDQHVGAGAQHFKYSCFSPFRFFSPNATTGEIWSGGFPAADTLDLNWRKDLRYFNLNNNQGISVYDIYWSDYIDSLYSKDARIITAYFKLDTEDLRTLTFDDIIYIKNNFYRIQKVYDAPLNEVSVVKVDLVKLINYTPEPCLVARPILITTEVVDATSPTATDGSITISFIGGVPPVAGYTLEVTGPNGYGYNNTIDQLQELEVTGLATGEYTISITDDCPTTATKVVDIADGCETAPPLVVEYTVVNEEYGTGNGQVTVTSSGGFGPYTATLDGQVKTTNPAVFTNLSAGSYNLTVVDQCGTEFQELVNILQLPGNVSTSTFETYEGANDGTISVTGYGSNTPLQYLLEKFNYSTFVWEFESQYTANTTGETHVFTGLAADPTGSALYRTSVIDTDLNESPFVYLPIDDYAAKLNNGGTAVQTGFLPNVNTWAQFSAGDNRVEFEFADVQQGTWDPVNYVWSAPTPPNSTGSLKWNLIYRGTYTGNVSDLRIYIIKDLPNGQQSQVWSYGVSGSNGVINAASVSNTLFSSGTGDKWYVAVGSINSSSNWTTIGGVNNNTPEFEITYT